MASSLTNFKRDAVVLGAAAAAAPGSNNPEDLVTVYDNTATYQKGDYATFKPAVGSEWAGLYQAISPESFKNKLPTDTAYWRVVLPPGPNVLLVQDTLNPALAALSAPGGAEAATITIADVESNTALPAFTVNSGKSYRVEVSEPRPTGRGTSMPADCIVKLHLRITENLNVDGSSTITLNPFWHYSAVGTAAAVAAIAAGYLTARVRVVEL